MKEKKITLRLTEEEYNSIKMSAENAGLSMSDSVRHALDNRLPQAVTYDPEVKDAIRSIHAYTREIAMEIEHAGRNLDDSYASRCFLEFANDKLLELNKKLASIESFLRSIGGR